MRFDPPDRGVGLFVLIIVVLQMLPCNSADRREANDPSTLTILVPRDERILSPANRGSASLLVFLELAGPNKDGVPVTAHDIAFTVNLLQHPDVIASTSNTGFGQVESVEVVDDHTLIMIYKPGSIWHTCWYPGYWHVFYPKHLLETVTLQAGPSNRHGIGSQVTRSTSWRQGSVPWTSCRALALGGDGTNW